MTGDLADAFIFEPVQCLGQALRPLCLGHLLLLEKMDNAFAVGRQQVALEDVVFVAAVCSQSYRDALNWLGSDSCEREMKEFGESSGVFDLQEKTEILCRYFEDGMRQPKFWTKEKNGSGPKADWKAHLFVALMSELNATPDDILERPLRGWLYLMLTLQERQGLIEIHGEYHRDLLDMAKRMEADLEKLKN